MVTNPNIVIEIKDQRRKSFYISDNAGVDVLGKVIGVYGHAVFSSILRHSNTVSNSWPGIALIAKEWGISQRQVTRSLNTLESLNVITIYRTDGLKNIYHINDQCDWKIPDQHDTPDCESVVPLTVSHPSPDCESVVPLTVSHPKNTHKKNTQEEDITLARFLFEEIIKANPHSRLIAQTERQRETTLSRWSKDINKLVHIDKQDPDNIKTIITKATQHEKFWARNIQCGESLRKNWDRLTSEFLLPKIKLPLIDKIENEKPKESYVLSKDGQWYRIDNGNTVMVDENQVPETIRNKAAGRPAQSPPPPVKSLITGILDKFSMPGVASG